jgi:UDP:flavonoid glycosyltransferase YjiC (YdhE family)
VCLTFGTVVGDVTRLTLLHRVVTALSGLDLDLIVAVDRGQRHLLGPLPGDPLVIGSVPLNVVLPSCDLVVHHGGAGTSMTAAAHGLPQLVLPHFADNFAHADQLAAYGAACRVDIDATGRTIRAAARDLLGDDRYRRRARSLQREISAQPPPSTVVHSLEGLMAADHRMGAVIH